MDYRGWTRIQRVLAVGRALLSEEDCRMDYYSGAYDFLVVAADYQMNPSSSVQGDPYCSLAVDDEFFPE